MKFEDFHNQSKSISHIIGKGLEILYNAGDNKKPGEIPSGKLFKDLKKIDQRFDIHRLETILALLEKIGLVYLDKSGGLRITSTNSRFVLGSLSKYLLSSRDIVTSPGQGEQEKEFYIQVTKALETLRFQKPNVDHDHLHSRRIVNVIIKGRQIGKWRYRDVYLHVYHQKWNQYHLIGLSHKNGAFTDDKIAELALLQHLNLETEPRQYELDPNIKPKDVEFTIVSESHGAITKYTVCFRVVTCINRKLNLSNLARSRNWGDNRFRWFTEDEIRNGEGKEKEKIMKSSQLVLEQIRDTGLGIRVTIKNAKDSRSDRRIVEEISNRVAIENFIPLLVGVLFVLVMRIIPQDFTFLGINKIVLAIFADLLGILGGAITVIKSIKGII